MEIAHTSRQRAGEVETGGIEHSFEDLLNALDAAAVPDTLAHERDCLHFMLSGWPTYNIATCASDCFTAADMIAQIEDVRACDPNGLLADVLDAIERQVKATAPTVQ